MPAFPWKERQPASPDARYVVMYSKLPLARHRFIPSFLGDTLRIRRQLAEAQGLVAYALKADLLTKTFWTVSAWTDEESLRSFAVTEPHRAITQRLRPRMGPTRFEVETVSGAELPIAWRVVYKKVS